MPELLVDAKMIASLLAIFKPTHLLEEDLKQRSVYLISQVAMSGVDCSEVWVVNNERRREIIQSQQGIAKYLASAKMQFMKPWFDEEYGSEPAKFWDYLKELTKLPAHSSDDTTRCLELEMYTNRISVACILLEQLNGDMAASLGDIYSSMFMRICMEDRFAAARVSYPAALLVSLQERFDAISLDRCPRGEGQVVAHLLDLVAAASACDAISRESCVQVLAKFLVDRPTGVRAEFIALVSSDLLAIQIIDYMLITWYSFRGSAGRTKKAKAHSISGAPGISKTAFCLASVCPLSKTATAGEWYSAVSLLTILVQRTMRAYCSRLCGANQKPGSGDSGDTEAPPTMLVVNVGAKVSDLAAACLALKENVSTVLPLQLDSGGEMDEGQGDDGSDSVDADGYTEADRLRMLCTDLDLLQAFLSA
ncbi:hypothetical protein GGF46_004354 [Coemansia sp. RSA 552]|nr:hypothetical protein GGF46_004354 [Coemansia sp. RSA 552]